MATWDDVRRVALALPEVNEATGPVWSVHRKGFVFRRPLRAADRTFLSGGTPTDDPLGAWVTDLDVKDALLVAQSDVYLTTPHFDGYPVVLARLDRLDAAGLEELVNEAWVARAPKRLARSYLERGT